MSGIARPVVVRPTEGSPSAFGMVHKLMADWYGGGLSVLEGTIAPGGFIPPHTHSREDECSYIISGAVTFELGSEVVAASTGCYVVKPRGVSHSFWNTGSEPARVMEMHSPGGFERHYDEMRELDSSGVQGEERRQAEAEIQRRYGVTFHWERVPALRERYGLRP